MQADCSAGPGTNLHTRLCGATEPANVPEVNNVPFTIEDGGLLDTTSLCGEFNYFCKVHVSFNRLIFDFNKTEKPFSLQNDEREMTSLTY